MASVIEGDVIPRLVQAHRPVGSAARRTRSHPARPTVGGARRSVAVTSPGADGADIEALGRALLQDDLEAANRLVARRLFEGEAVETTCARLLEPVGRLLEDRWAADACGLTDLTLGMGHLLALLHDLEHSDGEVSPWRGESRRVLLALAPGERHAFGVGLLGTLFRRAGWDVVDTVTSERVGALAGRLQDATAGAESGAAPVLVVWAGTLARLGEVPNELAALRRALAAQPARIVVAGPGVAGRPDGEGMNGTPAPLSGADAMADSAQAAVERAQDLLGPEGG